MTCVLAASSSQGAAEGLQDGPRARDRRAVLVCAQQRERFHRRPLQGLPRPPPVQLSEETLNAQKNPRLLQKPVYDKKILIGSFTPKQLFRTVAVSLSSQIS